LDSSSSKTEIKKGEKGFKFLSPFLIITQTHFLNSLKMKPITIESYIASNNPDEVMGLLRALGSVKPKDFDHMVRLLHTATEKYPERTFAELAKIETPYYQLAMSYAPEHEKVSGCDGGCSGCDGKKSNVDGIVAPAIVEKADNNKTVVIVPSFITQHPIPSAVMGTLLLIGTVVLIAKHVK
jgi:hypothetical protein